MKNKTKKETKNDSNKQPCITIRNSIITFAPHFYHFFSTFPSISLNLPEVGASEGDKAAVASAALEDRLRDALHRRRHRHEADSWM